MMRALPRDASAPLRHVARVVYVCDPQIPPRFIGMPQRSLASLVLAPVLIGVLLLALACVAGERTDRLGDTLQVADTLHVSNDDSIAASQLASSVDSAAPAARPDSAQQQGAAQPPAVTQLPATTTSRTTTSSDGSTMHRHARRMLSPLADSLANFLVVVPASRAWYTAASRGKHMLVDIGRIDTRLGTDSVTRAAYAEAMSHLSPLPVGSTLRLRGPWGSEDVRVKSFDVWNGRIVARVAGSRQLDSLARATDLLPATAIRFDSAAVRADSIRADSIAAATRPRTDSAKVATATTPPAVCVRDTLTTELGMRTLAVKDSLLRFLSDSVTPPYERLANESRLVSWFTPGCFGAAKVLVVANRRTPDMEFAVERAVLVDSAGRVTPLRVSDLRFKAHDALYVFDADGDGIDDLAAKGYGDRSGGVTILRLDPAARRLVRLSSGFAWER